MSTLIRHYVFWLAVASLLCLLAERIIPWRRNQKLWRPEFGQDVFWLVFNGYLSSFAFVGLFAMIYKGLNNGFNFVAGREIATIALLTRQPLWIQIVVVLTIADFTEWCVHNLLHRVGWLWRFHRMHHSITTMDWIGNFRFHWVETIIYQSIKYLPVTLLGARWEAMLAVAVISTMIGHLNHANLAISWGPLRYLLNSPAMHIWHHDRVLHGRAGANFAVVFSLWDWIFGTVYWPKDSSMPAALGYGGDKKVAHNLLMRFFAPFLDSK
jgi:sterol desaturase/sphingolipid hydroxylase (fatty acid hydroxylase superfamily)